MKKILIVACICWLAVSPLYKMEQELQSIMAAEYQVDNEIKPFFVYPIDKRVTD